MIARRPLLAILLVAGAGAQAQTVSERDRFGDAMRIGLPLAAAGYSLWRQDFEGLQQFALGWGTAELATEAIKRTFHDPRPTGAGHGAASAHAAATFAAAGYLHRRYGVETAAPAYALAAATAYSRVHTHHHFARQALAGAAVGVASGYLFARPLAGGSAMVVPQPGGIAIAYAARW